MVQASAASKTTFEEGFTQSSSLLELFWDLASIDAKTRCTSAQAMLEYFEAKTMPASHSAANTDWQQDYDEETTYTLNRLVRGLASSRQGARQGFALALLLLLKDKLQGLPCRAVLEVMDKHLQVTAGMKGFEEREVLLAKLFAFGALVRSGLLVGDGATEQDVRKSLEQLLDVAVKPHVREACYQIIFELVRGIKDKFPNAVAHLVDAVFPKDQPLDIQKASCDKLMLLLYLRQDCEDILLQRTDLATVHLLSPECLPDVALALRESTQYCHPHVHAAWPYLFNYMLETAPDMFSSVWNTTVEQALFDSSHERKYLGFQLMDLVLSEKQYASFSTFIMNANAMRTLSNNLSVKTNALYPVARKTFESLVKRAISDRTLMLQLVSSFCRAGASRRVWDDLTKLTHGHCWWTADTSKEEDHGRQISYLIDLFCDLPWKGESQDANATKSCRLWILDQLAFTASVCQRDGANMRKLLQFLFFQLDAQVAAESRLKRLQEFFGARKVADLSQVQNEQFKMYFWRATVAILPSNCSPQDAFVAMNSVLKAIYAWQKYNHKLDASYKVTAQTMDKHAEWKHATKSSSLPEATLAALGSFVALLDLIQVTQPTLSEELKPLQADVLESCLKMSKKPVDGEVHPGAVLFDVLLAFTSQFENVPHAVKLCKLIAELVMSKCCLEMGSEGFASLCQALNPLYGKQDAMEEGSGEDEEMEDVESSDADSDSDSLNGVIEVGKRKRDEVNEDDEDDDDENSEASDEEDLGDDQMGDYDAKLVEMFKLRKSAKSEKRLQESAQVNFVFRVMDLGESLIKCLKREKVPMPSPDFYNVALSLLQVAVIYGNPTFVLQALDKQHPAADDVRNVSRIPSSSRQNVANKALALVRELSARIAVGFDKTGDKEDALLRLMDMLGGGMGLSEDAAIKNLAMQNADSKQIKSVTQKLFVFALAETLKSMDKANSKSFIDTVVPRLVDQLVSKRKKLPVSLPNELFSRMCSFGDLDNTPMEQFLMAYASCLVRKLTECTELTQRTSQLWDVLSGFLKACKIKLSGRFLAEVSQLCLSSLTSMNTNDASKMSVQRPMVKSITTCMRSISKLDGKAFTKQFEQTSYLKAIQMLDAECAQHAHAKGLQNDLRQLRSLFGGKVDKK